MPSSSRSIPPTALVTLLLLLAFAGSAHAPTVSAASCDRQSSSVRVSLDQSEYPYTTDHTEDAIRADHPSLLHIDRDGADENREESLDGIPTKSGHDRDEYPPAVSEEGGAGASVRHVPSGNNRGAGAVMGNALEDWCEGQPFRLILVP